MIKDKLINKIKQNIYERNDELLDESVFDLNNFILEKGNIPEDIFESISSFFKEKTFLNMKKSWYLIKFFEENVDFFSDLQKRKVVEILRKAFDEFSDYTSCFLSVELIVKLADENSSLNILCSLQSTPNPNRRATVAHGYQEFIIEKSSNRELAECAINELVAMKTDNAVEVREAVEEEIRCLPRNHRLKLDKILETFSADG